MIRIKRGWGEFTKAYDEYISWVAPTPSKGGREKAFTIVPQKTIRWKLASKNRNIRFWKSEHPVFGN
jgi:hypothetical protein